MTGQRTLTRDVAFAGRGLHTGKKVNITVQPADPNHGILIRRTDPKGKGIEIPASWRFAVDAHMGTMLKTPIRVAIRTPEHFMAALYAVGIDNALVLLHGEEFPILDGSARIFVDGFVEAGTVLQNEPQRKIEVLKKVGYRYGKRFVCLEPARELEIDLSVRVTQVGQFHWQGVMTPELFADEMADARTFGSLFPGLWVGLLCRLIGYPLLRGASMKTCVVMYRGRVINPGGLRMPDEFLRHKLLDLIGDLALAGAPLIARVSAHNPTHRFNHAALRALFADRDAWRWTT